MAITTTTTSSTGLTPRQQVSAFIEENNPKELKLFLKTHRAVILDKSDGSTPLHEAASRGRLRCCRIIFKKGLPLDVKDHKGRYPAMLAVKFGHTDVAEWLYKKTLLRASDNKGKNFAHYLAKHDSSLIGTFSQKFPQDFQGRNVKGNSPLHLAFKHGSVTACNVILNIDIPHETKNNENLCPWELGNTSDIIQKAVSSNLLKVIQYIFEHNTQAVAQEQAYPKSLKAAVQLWLTDISLYLVSKGLDPYFKFDAEKSAFEIAEENNFRAFVDFVRENVTKDGQDTFFEPTTTNSESIIPPHLENAYQKVMENRTDFNEVKNGSTPLFKACRENNCELVECLLSCGAKPNVDLATYPLHIAVGNPRIVSLLIKYGANVNCQRSDPSLSTFHRRTPLHEAASKGYSDSVQILLEARAEINPRNGDDKTPLMLAKENLEAHRTRPMNSPEVTARLINNFELTIALLESKGAC